MSYNFDLDDNKVKACTIYLNNGKTKIICEWRPTINS